jgi:hypothetical protein
MDPLATISEPELTKVFRLGRSTWYQVVYSQGYIEEDGRSGGLRFYAYSTIDAYIRRQAKNCRAEPPTLQHLLAAIDDPSHPKRLLRLHEAAQLLNCPTWDVIYYLNTGAIGYVALGRWGSRRYIPAEEIDIFRKGRQNADAVKFADACSILMREHRTLRTLLDSGVIDRVVLPARSRQIYVSRSSMLNYLRGQLHDDIDVSDWYQKQEDAASKGEGWITKHEARFILKAAAETLIAAITDGRLAGMRVDTQWRIPLWAVKEYGETHRLLEAEDLSTIFGVNPTLAQQWIDTHSLCNLKHNRKSCPKEGCVIRYVAANRTSESIDPEEFVRSARSQRGSVLTDDATSTVVDMSREDVHEAIAKSLVPAVQLPNGSYALDERGVRLCRRYVKMLERAIDDPGYYRSYGDFLD